MKKTIFTLGLILTQVGFAASPATLTMTVDKQTLTFKASDFKRIALVSDEDNKSPLLEVSLQESAAKKLKDLSEKSIGKLGHMAINHKEFSAPRISSGLSGKFVITGAPLKDAVLLLEDFTASLQKK